MSYDLAVYSFDRPDLRTAVDAIRSDELRVQGDPAAEDQPAVALTRVTKREEQHLCTVDGPLLAEDEDVPPHVATTLLACNWTVQLNMPVGLPRKALAIVERLARRLADSGDGVVYDPQTDEVVWPRKPEKRREVAVAADTSDVTRLELEFLWSRDLNRDDALRLLDFLRRELPEAVPVRFGDYEPMQGRLERDGDEAFADLWDTSFMSFWNGKRPFEMGFVHLSRGWGSALSEEERESARPILGGRKAVKPDVVRLGFWPNVLDDRRWLVAIASVFERMCVDFRPFFAAGFLTPDRNFERVSLSGAWWLGVPDADPWIVYAGREYAPFLPTDLPGATSLPVGTLVKLAERPDDWTTIERRRIPWPADLVRRGDPLDVASAAATIPPLGVGG